MVQHARLIFYSLLLLVIPCEGTLAQKIPVAPIDSLITVGYATGSLKTLSGSVEKITETQMNKDQITNPLEAIRGRVPGLTIQRGSNGPAALDAVRLRGTTSLTSGNDPLIIVDGVFGDLSMLTSIYPTDIESFTILKDASETAQYGSRGASGVIEVTTKKGMSGRTQVAYNGSFGISTVYKNLKMLSGDEFRRVASERGISILDKGNNTDFQKEIEQTGLQQNHHIAFYGGSSESSYRVSLGFMDRQGVILNEDMKNFTSNMNMNQKMFDGFLNCELGMFGSIQKNHNLVDYQKTFYSAATFNPTYPNHKDPVTNSWDGITTASQITNPLAWMEVQDDDATSHISTHARLTFNLLEGLKLNLFGAYTYNIVENSQYLPTSVWANGQAYKGTKKRESLLGNMMLTYKKNWKKHFFDVLALAELQKETYTGYYTTVSNFSTDKFGYNNLQAGALRLWEGTNSYYDQPRLASFMGRFNYTYADRYVAGQAVPKTILGSNISFRYKRFDLSLQVNGAFGHKIYNGTSLTYMNMNIFPDYNVMKKAPKQNIKDQTATDYWLEKGDYVNFDYVTLGWNVPIEKVQKLKKYVRSLRLAFTVNNLATISGYSGLSPMINSSTVNSTLGVDDKRGYPLARTYTLGLSINF